MFNATEPVGVDAGLAGVLRQVQLEVDRMVRPPLTAAVLCSGVHDGSRQIVAGATLVPSRRYVQTVLARCLRFERLIVNQRPNFSI